MSPGRDASFEARFARSCIRRREKIRALVEEGGLERAPEAVAESVRMEVHSLAGEAALLRLDGVHDAAEVLENLFERSETRAGGEALGRALAWFDKLAELIGASVGEGGADQKALDALGAELQAAATGEGWWLAPLPSDESDDEDEALPEDRPRVLILDDSEISREAMADILEGRGYPVETAGNLLDFEEQLARFKPEVVLSDLNMPDIQGDEICRTLKARFETENVPIVLVSGLPDAELAQRAKAAGADGHVSKHHGPDRLLEILDELLSQIIF